MVQIRAASLAELDAAAELLIAAYLEYASAMPSEAWDAYAMNIADVRGRVASSELIVAAEEGELLGCVTFFPEAPKDDGWPAGYSYVRLLGVRPEARGRSIGKLLMEECVRRARTLGMRYLGLHTTGFMAVARGMYERMGFERVPRYDFTPTPGVVATAYRLALNMDGS